jgi:AraC-like DNA-binding protein/quercetin dioxygenase-like cupin family protein
MREIRYERPSDGREHFNAPPQLFPFRGIHPRSQQLRGTADRRGQRREFRVAGRNHQLIRASFGEVPAFTRHFHDSYSIGLVDEGTNIFSVGRKKVEAGAGMITVVAPGEVHDGGQAGVRWSYHCLYASEATIRAIATDFGLCSATAIASGSIADWQSARKLRWLFNAAFADPSDLELEELAIEALSVLLLRHGTERSTSLENPSRYKEVAHAAVTSLQDRWDQPVYLDELSRELNTSRFIITRAVAAVTGLTPHAYLLQLRTDRALEMIREGTSLAQAAVASGFSDQSHLSREIKKRWGVTPGCFAPL